MTCRHDRILRELPRLIVVVMLGILARPLFAQEPVARQYPVPGHGALALPVPEDWRVSVKPLDKPAALVLRFDPASGSDFIVQATAVPLSLEQSAGMTPEQIRQSVRDGATKPLGEAVERDVVVEELRGPQAAGYYYSLTARTPAPDGYRHLTQGTLVAGGLMMIFTILHRNADAPEKAAAIRMLAGATHSKADGAPPGATMPRHFQFDMIEPRVRIVLPDLPPMRMDVHPDAASLPHARYLGTSPDGYTVSVLTPASAPGMSARDCANTLARGIIARFSLDPKAISTGHVSETTSIMLFPLYTGPLLQFKAHVLSGHGGAHCVEVHVSKLIPAVSKEAAVEQLGAWFKGFRGADIVPY